MKVQSVTTRTYQRRSSLHSIYDAVTPSRFHVDEGLSCDCCPLPPSLRLPGPLSLPSFIFCHLGLDRPVAKDLLKKISWKGERKKRQIFNLTVKIALEMSADMRPGGTMRLSNPPTGSLMRSLRTDRKHVRCYLSRLMEVDLPLFPSLSVSSRRVTLSSQKSSGVSEQTRTLGLDVITLDEGGERLALCSVVENCRIATLSIIARQLKKRSCAALHM